MKKFKRFSKSKMIIVLNLLLILTLMITSVYAWFASQVENSVTAYDIQVESDDALELSFDQETWGGALNLANYMIGDTSVMDSVKLVEVTSDGTNFRIPQLEQKANYAEVITDGSWANAVSNQDYFEFTVYMRSKDELSVYLSSDSAATPSSTVLTGASCGNPSSYGSGDTNFSRDCVVGALRVSYKNANNKNYIWITNPKFHLNNTVGSATYTMTTNATESSFNTGTGASGAEFYWNNPYVHYYYSGSNITTYSSTYTLTQITESVSEKPSGTDTLLANLTEDGDYYTGQVTFKIWIEGCDTEARRALVDGKFNLSLVFDTYPTA